MILYLDGDLLKIEYDKHEFIVIDHVFRDIMKLNVRPCRVFGTSEQRRLYGGCHSDIIIYRNRNTRPIIDFFDDHTVPSISRVYNGTLYFNAAVFRLVPERHGDIYSTVINISNIETYIPAFENEKTAGYIMYAFGRFLEDKLRGVWVEGVIEVLV